MASCRIHYRCYSRRSHLWLLLAATLGGGVRAHHGGSFGMTRRVHSFKKVLLSSLSSSSTSTSTQHLEAPSPLQTRTLLELRGGSTKVASPPPKDDGRENDASSLSLSAVQSYQLQQQLLLQSRSVVLRQALIDRGLTALQFTQSSAEAAMQPTDWDCAMSTTEHPKSCLYSFDAEPGAKVVAPRDSQEWITLAALNRLRRTDPTKVDPLWHDKYAILKSWFHPTQSQYSLYSYLTPRAALVSFLLDTPAVLIAAMASILILGTLIFFPVWEAFLQNFLTSSLVWMQWPHWARFVHAAFPLKFLLGQMVGKAISSVLRKNYGRIRHALIELECQLWEECIPRTMVEDKEEQNDNEVVGEDEEESNIMDDDDDTDLR